MQLYRGLITFIIAIALASSSRIDAANAQAIPKEPLINLRIMAHCAFDSRGTGWTGS